MTAPLSLATIMAKKSLWPWALLLMPFSLWAAQTQNLRELDDSVLQAVQTQPLTASSLAARSMPAAFETRLRNALGLSTNNSFRVLAEGVDRDGNRHQRLRQYFAGVPVFGEQVLVHSTANGQLRSLSGKSVTAMEQAISVQDAQKQRLSQSAAMKRAKAHAKVFLRKSTPSRRLFHGTTFRNEAIERVIFVEQGHAVDAYVISYVVEAPNAQPVRPFLIMDADNGTILKRWDAMAHGQAEGTGPGGNLKTGIYEYGDIRHPALDIDKTGNVCSLTTGSVITVNANHASTDSTKTTTNETPVPTAPFTYDCGPRNPGHRNAHVGINGGFAPLNDAHRFGIVTESLYKTLFKRQPLNEPAVLRVHFGVAYDNAFWDGKYSNFGDGNAEIFPLSTSLNVVAHEISHGVTEENSNLVYYGQSGGINEAFSDIAGEAAEFFQSGNRQVDWLVGAEVMQKKRALRYFANPTRDGISIGHAANFYETMEVHRSSGVFNRAFYLLATSPGWNVEKAFTVFYHANVYYWSPLSDFNDAACGVIDAVNKPEEISTVVAAFKAVGVSCPTASNPQIVDADGDHMDDRWEQLQAHPPTEDPDQPLPKLDITYNDAGEDPDGDGWDNLAEYRHNTNPFDQDSDNDGINDGVAIKGDENDPDIITDAGNGDPFPNDPNWLGFVSYNGIFSAGHDLQGAMAGSAVASADVDGDQFADTIIGAPYYSPYFKGKRYKNVGLAMVVSGRTGRLIWAQSGAHTNSLFGYSVAATGSLDGDDVADFVVGAPGFSPLERNMKSAGAVFVYSLIKKDGNGQPAPPLIGTLIGKAKGDRFGWSVDGVNDAVGKGTGDIVVGAPFADVITGEKGKKGYKKWPDAGAAYVIKAQNGQVTVTLSYASTGYTEDKVGAHAADHFGWAVAGIGDIDGDGLGDVLVGAPHADKLGEKDAGRAFPISVYREIDFWLPSVVGDHKGDQLGSSVSALDDVGGVRITDPQNPNNQLPIADFAVGAPKADAFEANNITVKAVDAGMVKVCEGQGNYHSGAVCHRLYGQNAGDYLGTAIANLRSLTVGGTASLLVGASGHDLSADKPNTGMVQAFSGEQILAEAAPQPLWQITGKAAGDFLGAAVATGDINKDASLDAVIGASGSDNVISTKSGQKQLKNTGAVSIISGKSAGDVSVAKLTQWIVVVKT